MGRTRGRDDGLLQIVHVVHRKLAAVFLLALLVVAPATARQDRQEAAHRPPAEGDHLEIVSAPVVIDGEVLFDVRGVSAYPAEVRARQIADRIRTLAKNPRVTPSSFVLEDHPGATWVVVNGRRLLAAYDEDAILEGVVNRHLLAEIYRAKISEAITAYRNARQPAVLWRHALLTVAATLALIVSAYLLWRGLASARIRLESRYSQYVHDVSVKSFPLVRADQLWRAVSAVFRLGWAVTLIGLVIVYLRYTLPLFPWTRGTGERLVALVVATLRDMTYAVVAFIPNVVFLVILFLVTRALLKVVRLFFSGLETGSVRLRNFERDWALPTHRLVRVLIIVFALIVAFPYVPGSDSDAFKGITIFIGLVFSLGSSSLIGNLISGYSMTYRRMFRVGDRVRIGEHLGEVREMRLLVTHLRTPKNEEVIVPNSAIVGTEVVNYSSLAKAQGLILHTTVGIGYETPWRQVEAMLLEAAARTPGLLRDRPPFVFQTALGDFCVTYELNVYCDAPERMRQLYTELHRNILDVFNEYDVQIMTPAYEMDPIERKVVPKERWFAEPARPPAPSPLTSTQSERSPS